MVAQAPFLTVHQPVHPNLHPGDGDGDRHVEQEEDGEQQGQRHPATCKEYPVADFNTDEEEAEEGLRRTDGEVGEIFNRRREDDGSVGSAVKEHPHDLVEHPQKEHTRSHFFTNGRCMVGCMVTTARDMKLTRQI